MSIARKNIITNNSLFHITWQCHNKQFFLEPDDVKQKYYNLLLKYKEKYKIKIFSYCFMSSHPHLVGHCETVEGLSNFMRVVDAQLAKFINKKFKKCGQAIMDRFKSPVIENQKAMKRVVFYVDLNPYKAKMIKKMGTFKWSSYNYYAFGKKDKLITPVNFYIKLSKNLKLRKRKYRELINNIISQKAEKELVKYNSYFIGSAEWITKKTKNLRNFKKNKLKNTNST